MQRTILAGAIGLLLTLAVSAASAAPVWPSGMVKVDRLAAQAWRGSPLDAVTAYFDYATWGTLVGSSKALKNWVNSPAPIVAVGVGMLPKTHAGQLAACADGAFDAYIAAIRANVLTVMANAKRPDRLWYIRLGWEANRNKVGSGFPWKATDPAAWVGCYRRWATILNPPDLEGPEDDAVPRPFRFIWNMSNRGTTTFPIDEMYPGNDVVDVIGSQFYDRCPAITTDALWKSVIFAVDKVGNPAGPGAWLAYAKAKGKPYAIPEWGIGGSTTICAAHGFDNPYFMRRWYWWLRGNAADIAFEAYFNGRDGAGGGDHQLFPVKAMPKAAAVYRNLW